MVDFDTTWDRIAQGASGRNGHWPICPTLANLRAVGMERHPSKVEATRINAIVPLAVLQSVRSIDQQGRERTSHYPEDLAPKRLGMNPTVMAQIERYAQLVNKGGQVEVGETGQLFRLVGRRSDAGLVFSQGGRWAARRALASVSTTRRLTHKVAPSGLRGRLGLATASRVASKVFGVELSAQEGNGVVAVANQEWADAILDGTSCGFYGAALAELLRELTDFDGAMIHVACSARGDDTCRWQTSIDNGGA